MEATDFPERAGAIADQIARHDPEVVGLQEVALWEKAPPGGQLQATYDSDPDGDPRAHVRVAARLVDGGRPAAGGAVPVRRHAPGVGRPGGGWPRQPAATTSISTSQAGSRVVATIAVVGTRRSPSAAVRAAALASA